MKKTQLKMTEDEKLRKSKEILEQRELRNVKARSIILLHNEELRNKKAEALEEPGFDP